MALRPTLIALLLSVALHAPASGQAEPAAESNPTDLVRVFRCLFDSEWDVNYDDWPDRWTRLRDDQHPGYVRMRIEPLEGDGEGAQLVIRPDGASARLTSPPIRVIPKFSYKVRLRVRVKGAKHGVARLRMEFRNRRNEVLQVEQSTPLLSDGVWREVEMGDYQPRDEDVDRLHLHVDYERGERGDLEAEVAIADMRMYRLPSIQISTDSRYNVYTDPSQVMVTCSLSGIDEQNPEIRFQLLDATNQTISDGGALTLDGRVISEAKTHASDIVDGFGSNKSSFEGSKNWQPPIRGYGFYRVRVGMYSESTGQPIGEDRSITLAVVREDLERAENGEFGWSLPRGDRPLAFKHLQELLPIAGVNRVKLPVWYPVGSDDRGDELLRFAEQLSARGVETIGVLDDPSRRVANPLDVSDPPAIQGLLSADESVWTPLLDHVISKLSLRIRWWQLGHDGDTSFVGLPKVIDRLRAIRNQLFRFGQDIRLGLGWRWDHVRAWREPLPWDFEQMAGGEGGTAAGLDRALAEAPPSTAFRWVLVKPPASDVASFDPNGDYADRIRQHQRRVRDFVEQIVVAKVRGADGIFVADPFSGSADPADGRTGVMNEDGTPGELLLPWRTCARLLGGARYLGSIRMPRGSRNWLFKRQDGRIVMVLWNLDAETDEANAMPIEEELYLGDSITTIDIWGARNTPSMREGRHVIPVGRMPRFVLGLDEGVARWRMNTKFETLGLPSIFGVTQPNTLMMTNTFGQGVGGRVRVVVPAGDSPDPALSSTPSPEWRITPDQHPISLPAQQTVRLPFDTVLKNAEYGPQIVRVDVQVSAEEDRRFSVWRELSVGAGDVELDVVSSITSDGSLTVEQRLRKTTGVPADFLCLLYASDRRRKRAQVFQLGPEVDKRRYKYLNAEDLVGTTMILRIEEVDGNRVLIHRFRVEPTTAPAAEAPYDEEASADTANLESGADGFASG